MPTNTAHKAFVREDQSASVAKDQHPLAAWVDAAREFMSRVEQRECMREAGVEVVLQPGELLAFIAGTQIILKTLPELQRINPGYYLGRLQADIQKITKENAAQF